MIIFIFSENNDVKLSPFKLTNDSQVGLATIRMIMIVTNAATTTAIKIGICRNCIEVLWTALCQAAVAAFNKTEQNIQTFSCQIGNELAEECVASDDNKVWSINNTIQLS